MSSACEQLWPVCTPVFINVDPVTLMAERKSRQCEHGGAGGEHLEKQKQGAFADIRNILHFRW